MTAKTHRLEGTAAPVSAREPLAAVRAWLWTIAGLVVAIIVVGGATRLTDSGLSITEWQLITGTLPPLGAADWAEAFEKYKAIPEYALVNKGMSLEEFKFIYWWEWSHRFLGRFIGLVFFVPLVVFWAMGRLPARAKPWLVVLLLLGGAQGALGWYMVKSGLVDRVDVSQYRLMAHLGLAFVVLATAVWIALSLRPASSLKPNPAPEPRQRGGRTAILLTASVFLQILLGALVAGIDAGFAYNSWPLIDGALVPAGLFQASPWYLNMFESIRTVQFDHRMVAYAVWLLALVHAARLWRLQAPGWQSASLLAVLLTAQAATGIWTLLMVVPLELGLLHQFGAALVWIAAIAHLHGFFRTDLTAPRAAA